MTAAVLGLSANTAFAIDIGACTHVGHRYSVPDNLEAASGMKLDWVRDECRWSAVEPTKGAEKKIPSGFMSYVIETDKAGINQLLILGYGNRAYGVENESLMPTKSNPEYYNAFLDYVRFMVSEVKDYVDAYEVWNEPNIKGFNYNLAGSGADYAALYLDTREIIKELDPDATVVCGCITGVSDEGFVYTEDIFNYIKTQGDVNSLIDAFSIHLYTDSEWGGLYISALLYMWEPKLESYGYTGDVWMTETGAAAVSNITDDIQARYMVLFASLWEYFLTHYERNGVMFWYDLRNDGTDASYNEHNFGLVDYSYKPKPAYYAMRAFKQLTEGKTLVSYTTPVIYSSSDGTTRRGIKAQYSGDNGVLYAVANQRIGDSADRTISVALSGDVAYVYDCMGNVTETIENPRGNKAITPGTMPVYVECVTYSTKLDDVSYDKDTNIVTVSGTSNLNDTMTVELVDSSGEIVRTETALVKDREFTKWFSVDEPGTYTIIVGRPELTALGKSSGWAQASFTVEVPVTSKPVLDSTMVIAYDADTRTVNLTGSVTNSNINQNITLLALPKTEDVTNIEPDSIAALMQSKTSDGDFGFSFVLPDWYSGDTAVYISGTEIADKRSSEISVADNKYIYAAGFKAAKTESIVTASANVRNFAAESKGATIIIAKYAGDRCVGTSIRRESIPAHSYSPIQISASAALSSDITKIQAYLWDSAEGLRPLSQSVELK